MLASYVFLGIPCLLYWAQAVNYAYSQGRHGMALAFFAYGLGNIGFLWDAFQMNQLPKLT